MQSESRGSLITLASGVCLAAVLLLASHALPAAEADTQPVNIGSRLEPLIDDFLIDKLDGAKLRLNHPTPREIAITFDAPWEGNCSACSTVFRDGDKYRMYYRCLDFDPKTKKYTKDATAYAESTDGKVWTKPKLGLCDFKGAKANNLIWQDVESHNFTPFIDQNPNGAPDARYKAVGGGSRKTGMRILKSSDGIHWQRIQPNPAITDGAFDSQNLAFWWPNTQSYVAFFRTFSQGDYKGIRDISTATSKDFIHWGKTEGLTYGDAPHEHLYTNGIAPYDRAPHVLMGFPKRFWPDRKRADHPFGGVSEVVFMTSRDGQSFRRWQEAWIRPGLMKERWVNRNNITAYGMLVTKSDVVGMPDELSFYSLEGYYVGPCRLRRYTLRIDGFVSLNAPFAGGEMITKPVVFQGAKLIMNYSTSAAGSVRVEIQDPSGKPIEGFALADCPEIYGDSLAETVRWKGGDDVVKLAGKPVRLRFVLKDADLYSIRFQQ
ncbi:MAG: hypothetical protein JXQ73_07515 [Phycisphaerae bacterium]|nr:hypothetical protein [Phycisphaerae bacterium]